MSEVDVRQMRLHRKQGHFPLAVPWKQDVMSRVENLEEQVKELNAEELRAFREWFAEFDADAWDRQIESDARSGKLDELAARALRDYKARL